LFLHGHPYRSYGESIKTQPRQNARPPIRISVDREALAALDKRAIALQVGIGIVAGWLASWLVGGSGMLHYVMTGLAGSLIGGFLLERLGIEVGIRNQTASRGNPDSLRRTLYSCVTCQGPSQTKDSPKALPSVTEGGPFLLWRPAIALGSLECDWREPKHRHAMNPSPASAEMVASRSVKGTLPMPDAASEEACPR
jgi:uncharacterized membrane protein YeaQ/YmgE (transglycosylase-associated protein family)